jgi:hypothetical protein
VTLGGVEMNDERTRPRALRILRSVLLAGAGSLAWLTLSAGGASADSTAGLLDELKPAAASVTSASHALQGVLEPAGKLVSVPSAVAAQPASGIHATPKAKPALPQPATPAPALLPQLTDVVPQDIPVPALQPTVSQVAESTDQLLAAGPVLNEVLPADVVSGVLSPVADPVLGAVDDVTGLVPPVVDDVIGPLVDDVFELVPSAGTDAAALVPADGLGDVPFGGPLVPVGAAAPPLDEAEDIAWLPSGALLQGVHSSPPTAGSVKQASSLLYGAPLSPSGQAAGSGSSTGNTSLSAAAWVQELPGCDPPFWSTLVPMEGSPHITPVSFDPGSSPD